MMKACDNKLKSCLIEMMEQEEASLKEELQHTEPHVFSEAYRSSLEKAMQVRKRKKKVYRVLKYVAAVLAAVLLTGGILFIGSENLNASNMSIDILEWLEKFFTVEVGEANRSKEGILFDESRLEYLPEGFEKSSELVTFSNVQYGYTKEDSFIYVTVTNSKQAMQVDNEGVKKEVRVNEAGFEYTYVYKEGEKESKLIWRDNEENCYSISGNVDSDELIKIMNGISY